MDKYFQTLTLDNSLFVDLDVFISFLKRNHSPGDVKKEIRAYNVIRILNGYKGGIKESKGRKYIPVKSVLRYIFHSAEELQICDNVSDFIVNRVFNCNLQSGTVLDLYNSVAESDVIFPTPPEAISNDIEEKLDTLFTDYREKFSRPQWIKIVLFEWHFMKNCQAQKSGTVDEYEIIVSEKWKYFNFLLTASTIGQSVVNQSRDIARERTCRLSFGNDTTHILRCKQRGYTVYLKIY